MKQIESLGFDSWFQAHFKTSSLTDHELARVIAVHKDSYIISKGLNAVFAVISGKRLYAVDSTSDLPTTGDWVVVDFYDNDSHAIIHDIVPRRTVLKRKSSGKSSDFQLIAANIDVAFIIQSANENFNVRRLERYLVMINDNNITPVILLSKCDLKPQHEINLMIENIIRIAPQTTLLQFSNHDKSTIDAMKDLLLYGHTYCLVGSSGVGKTTLLNNIIGRNRLMTKSVSKKDSKGKHTTTSRELIQLDNGAMIIDTPGMRELGNIAVDTGIETTFSDIVELSLQCRFNDCKHTNEKACAILAAIAQGTLPATRLQNYNKMKNESSFNEMSYYEKRQKNKNTGKFLKSVVKERSRR